MSRRSTVRIAALTVLAAVACPVTTATAASDTAKPPAVFGALTQLAAGAGCEGAGATSPCRADDSLQRVTQFSVSPDDRQVVTTTLSGGGGVVVFNRAASGALSFAGCVSVTGHLGSAQARTCAVDTRLGNPIQALFTSDGRSLIVIGGANNGTLLDFDHNPKTGALHSNSSSPCFDGNGSGGCESAPELSGPETVLEDASDHLIYVGSEIGVETLLRDPKTGAMAHLGCLDADGLNGCTQEPVVESGIGGLAFDPSTRQVWAASQFGGALLSLHATSHGDVVDQCLTSAAASMYCGHLAQIAGPLGLAVVRHGGTYGDLYVTDISSNALLHFHLNNAGQAVLIDCRAYSGSIAGGATTCTYDFAMSRPWAVTASPDGRDVYVAAANGGTSPAGAQLVAAYARSNSSGDLSPLPSPYRCVKAEAATAGAPLRPGCTTRRESRCRPTAPTSTSTTRSTTDSRCFTGSSRPPAPP